MKKVFVIDWWLVALFIVTVVSGFGMHVSGNRCSHEIWHDWAVVHTISSVAFLVAGMMHMQTHWGWYKGWFKNGRGNKSRVTVLLSIVFVLTAITGIISLVAAEGCNSGIGLFHYTIGKILLVIGLCHIIKRIPVLKKSITH